MTVWDGLIGQDDAVHTLQAAAAAAADLAAGRPAPHGVMTHAWLFTGPPGVLLGVEKVKIVLLSQPGSVPQAAVSRVCGRPEGFCEKVPRLCRVVMKLLTFFWKRATESKAPGWKYHSTAAS